MASTVRRACWLLSGGVIAAVSCGKQTGDEGQSRQERPSYMVENEADNSPPREEPPQANAGGFDSCSAETWESSDAEPTVVARCQQYIAPNEPNTLRYICACDESVCPLYGEPIDDGNPMTPPEVPFSDCVTDEGSIADVGSCSQVILSACGVEAGQNGFCHDVAIDSVTSITCFTQPDGTHSCRCPGRSALVPSNERDCHRAMLTACQEPCSNADGSCEPSDAGGHDCSCAIGLTWRMETGICIDALHWCKPHCRNERGACYYDPERLDLFCQCNGESELHRNPPDSMATGDECFGPLVALCGGSDGAEP